MPEFTYPAELIDRPRQLLSTLGSFWARTYLGKDQALSFTEASAQIAAQTQLDLLELIASMSRFTTPIWHRDNWYLLLVKESELNGAKVNLPRYGDSGIVYDGGLNYDSPRGDTLFAFPAPAALVRVPLAMNRITSPSVTWTNGIDFLLDPARQAIVFRANPFENPLFAIRDIYTDGEITDREAAIWLFRGEFDFNTVYEQFGYVLKLKLKSSRGYRDLINALMDALVCGPTALSTERALATMAGIPLVQETYETVEVISSDKSSQLIVTDKHVYRFSMRAVPAVAVGDVVTIGQSLVDAFEVFEFNRGITPDELQALAAGRGLLAGCFYGDLIFDNREVPLEVDEDHPSGYTFVKFGLGGFPADVTAFFDEVHHRGVVAYESNMRDACERDPRRIGTLAHLLDTRTNRDGEPRARNLPTTINPLKFLIENVLRNNAYVIKIKVAGMGPDAAGLYNVRHLQRTLPPHTALILMYEFTVPADTVVAESVSDVATGFLGVAVEDTVPESLVSERPVGLRMISGTCQ